MKKRKKYNKANPHQAEILALKKQGLSLSEIGEKVGLTKSQVHYSLYQRKPVQKKLENLTMVKLPSSLKEDKIQRINTLSNWGYKPFEISEDVNLPTPVVTQVVSNLMKCNLITLMV